MHLLALWSLMERSLQLSGKPLIFYQWCPSSFFQLPYFVNVYTLHQERVVCVFNMRSANVFGSVVLHVPVMNYLWGTS